jgi:putative oxidoreductase
VTDQFDLALAVLRIAVGTMITLHGYAHIFKNGKLNIKGTAGWFESMGMRPPLVQAWLASVTELGAGALLVVGLLTPLAAAGLFSVMLVAFMTAHRTNGFFIYNPGQGWEYVGMIMVIAVVLGTLGAGGWSLDHALEIIWWRGWRGLATVLVLGGGGAAALLATCWRPPAKN